MPPAAKDGPDGQHQEEAMNGNNGGGFSFNSSIALYHSMDALWNAAFIILSYVVLLALFYFLRLFEMAPSEASWEPLRCGYGFSPPS
ncbi:hypothetical protein Cni_G10270 [Canna indica]|uniref:Uncharacterized protein n=1 Tax=Canna indica TaxID=4628 RepID=A0AAQ3K684_9LILI|nr:hypothetical protein Cni_G10270 [Canna indica]